MEKIVTQRWFVLVSAGLFIAAVVVCVDLWRSGQMSVSGLVTDMPETRVSPGAAIPGMGPSPPVVPPAASSSGQPSPSPSLAGDFQGFGWREVEYDAASGLPDRRQKYAAARLVSVDLATWRGLEDGDRIDLQIPQLDDAHTIWIDTVERTTAGVVTLTGSVDSATQVGFVMTLGQGTMFATIWTEQGSFNLDGRGELAWIIADRDLRAHIDYTKPDVL